MNTQASVKPSSRFRLSDKAKRVIVDVICYLYVLLFLYAATSKLLDYDNSELQMSKSPIITDYASILVWIVPLTEIIISILLLLDKLVLLGLYSAFTLMIIFTAYIIIILNFSDVIPCSCGGILESMNWEQHLIFNVCFLILGIAGIIIHLKHQNQDK